MRGVSTVLDVTLCLLFVGAAVAALSVPTPPTPDSTADETAEGLAAATANLSESVSLRAGGSRQRRVHGTAAELLARAALANLTLDGHRLAPTTATFRGAVRERVRRTLAWAPERTAVTARWRPYPGAPLHGQLSVGPTPPSGVAVGTARLTVPAPFPAAAAGADDSFRTLARDLSDRVLAVTLPAGPARRLTSRKSRRLEAYASALAAVDDAVAPDRARRQIRAALADRLAADMRERFDSPREAAAALRAGRVTIVVREWSS